MHTPAQPPQRKYPRGKTDFVRRGFTLIELLLVVGIVTVLATVTVFTLNPVELLRQSRDSNRVAELASLKKAIALYELEQGSTGLGTPQRVYVSVGDPSITDLTPGVTSNCANIGLSAATLPSGWAYVCVHPNNLQRTDKNGWLPINFGLISSGSPFTALPIDPVNTMSSGLYYTYVSGGSYALTGAMESGKYIKQIARADQGTDLTRYELGSDITLWAKAKGLVGYWPLDEGLGTTATDASGNGLTGTAVGSPFSPTGKVGGDITIGGSTQYVIVNDSTNSPLDLTGDFTIAVWFKRNQTLNEDYFITKLDNFGTPYELGLFGSPKVASLRMCTKNPSTCEAGGCVSVLASGATYPTTVWRHIVGTFNRSASELKIYVEGVLRGTANGALPSTTNNAALWIGRSRSAATCPFRGDLDDVRIYNRALDPTEVTELYGAGNKQLPP